MWKALRDAGDRKLLYVVDAPLKLSRRRRVALEDTHTLGRLWDLDVIDGSMRPLTRLRSNCKPAVCAGV